MTDRSTRSGKMTIGIDLGDDTSHVCVLDGDGEIVERGTVATTKAGLRKRFSRCEPSRIAIEVGVHSAWVAELLRALGHEVIVANARRLRMIYANDSKSDEIDAEQLARVARLDPKLLHPIQHRQRSTRVDLTVARSRDALVATRTTLINHVRGVVKSFGVRLGSRNSRAFPAWAREGIPDELHAALEPVLATLESVVSQIKVLEVELVRMARDRYPETALLRQIDRVGLHTALRFVLTVEDPDRIRRSRDVAAYFGLRPKRRQSGSQDPELRITKAGDSEMRRHLVQCAQQILGHFGKDSDLRRWGLQLAARGGKAAKKKAIVAVARKLAVVLHVLWRTGQVYEPLRNAQHRAVAPSVPQAVPA